MAIVRMKGETVNNGGRKKITKSIQILTETYRPCSVECRMLERFG